MVKGLVKKIVAGLAIIVGLSLSSCKESYQTPKHKFDYFMGGNIMEYKGDDTIRYISYFGGNNQFKKVIIKGEEYAGSISEASKIAQKNYAEMIWERDSILNSIYRRKLGVQKDEKEALKILNK